MKKSSNDELKVKKKRKISFQKIFCVISLGFLLGCLLFYGNRFFTLYKENKAIQRENKNTLAMEIKNQNNKKNNFSKSGGNYYFINDTKNNYLKYSNILWRIIKINDSNEIVLIAENPITNLAFGVKKDDFSSSYINNWLNKNDTENSGIFENLLNNKEAYLSKNSTCIDELDTISNKTCKNKNKNSYIGLLSIEDYVNTGANKSYINNDTTFYLTNENKDKEIWVVNESNKISTSNGEDIFGIKPVITLKSNVEKLSGDGTKEKPYIIEKENPIFGSYVKLGNDIWQIYDVKGETINLVLNGYLKTNEQELLYAYSTSGYAYSTKSYKSLANYLNNTYIDSLSYKYLINTNNWNNGYYGSDNGFDYTNIYKNSVSCKIGLLSINDVLLNHELTDYVIMTGIAENSNLTYAINNNGTVYSTNVTTKNYIVPTININKELLKNGSGSLNDPYGVE